MLQNFEPKFLLVAFYNKFAWKCESMEWIGKDLSAPLLKKPGIFASISEKKNKKRGDLKIEAKFN